MCVCIYIVLRLDYNFINNKCRDHFCARPRGVVVTKAQSLTSKENPPTCCLISCKAKRVVYH